MRGRPIIHRASDISVNLDRIEAGRAPREWVYLQGRGPWSMAEHAAAWAGVAPCPTCGGGELAPSRYCLGCDRAGLDGLVRYPGEPVGSRLDPDYLRGEPSRPGPLRGGRGLDRRKDVG